MKLQNLLNRWVLLALLSMMFVALFVVIAMWPTVPSTPGPAMSPLSPLAADGIGPTAVPKAVQPTPKPTESVPGNLLANPSFEGDYVSWGQSVNVAPDWTPWSTQGNPPPCVAGTPGCYIPCPQNCVDTHPVEKCATDYGCWWQKAEHKEATLAFPGRVHSGEDAQQAFTAGRMGEFGVLQTVTVPVGSLLNFSAYVQAWQCFDWRSLLCQQGKSDLPDEMNLRLGIGTMGEVDPYMSTIVWGNPSESFDQYSLISVVAMARNPTVTVFTYARPEWAFARNNNDAYWDDAVFTATLLTHTIHLPLVLHEGEPVPTAIPTPSPPNLARTTFLMIPNWIEVGVGDTFTLTGWIDSVHELEVSQVMLRYDSQTFDVVRVTPGNIMTLQPVSFWPYTVDPLVVVQDGMVIYESAGIQRETSGGTLFSLALQAHAMGEYIIEPVSPVAVFLGLSGGGGINPPARGATIIVH